MVIVISGPIASGKSAIARGLARDLESRGVSTAVVDLDLLYEQEVRGAPVKRRAAAWLAARRAAAALARSHLDDGITAVVVEGSFQTHDDRAALLNALRTENQTFIVSLEVSFAEALRRAQADETRGRSRDAAFLRRYYSEPRIAPRNVAPADLVIDTERLGEKEAVGVITRSVLALRDARPPQPSHAQAIEE